MQRTCNATDLSHPVVGKVPFSSTLPPFIASEAGPRGTPVRIVVGLASRGGPWQFCSTTAHHFKTQLKIVNTRNAHVGHLHTWGTASWTSLAQVESVSKQLEQKKMASTLLLVSSGPYLHRLHCRYRSVRGASTHRTPGLQGKAAMKRNSNRLRTCHPQCL